MADWAGTGGVSVDRLYREVAEDAASERSDGRAEATLNAVSEYLFGGDRPTFDDDAVKGDLREILVALVALGETDTHGSGLMNDLSTLFDADLSPGTVYPRLHGLEDDGVLEMQELVRTKEYRVADGDAAREALRDRMEQHLTLAAFMHAALEELDGQATR